MSDSTSSEDMRSWPRYRSGDPWAYWDVEDAKWLYGADWVQSTSEDETVPSPRKRLNFDSDSDSGKSEYPLEVFALPLEMRKMQRDSDSDACIEWSGHEYARMVFDLPSEEENELSRDLLPAEAAQHTQSGG